MKQVFLALSFALLPLSSHAEDSTAAAQATTTAPDAVLAQTSTSPLPPVPTADAAAGNVGVDAASVTPIDAGIEVAVDPTLPAPSPAPASPVTTGSLSTEPVSTEAATSEASPAIAAPESTLPPHVRTGAEVFARLRSRLSPPACPDSESVQRWRKRYAGHPTVFARHLAEILPLLDFVVSEVEASGLPGEFAFIPLIESWYRPDAIGSGGPAGMWQMIASTARNHGIHIKPGYDGRLSPVESTRAALSYLKTLHEMFDGDWQAAMMAYNAGEYRLLKAFKRDGVRTVSAQQRKPRGLSNITYDYIFKLQALSCLVTEPERQGLILPLETRFTALAPVLVEAQSGNLGHVSRQTGIDAGLLARLNPGYRNGKIVAGVPRMVLMPASALSPRPEAPTTIADTGAAATPPADGGASNDGRHQVKRGDTLYAIAKRYGLSLEHLLQLNKLSRKAIIRAGQSLKVLP